VKLFKARRFYAVMETMQKLKFYDVKARQAFEVDRYEVVEKQTPKGVLVFAVATSPYTGIKVYRLLGRKK
jgi:hypothetical protein